MPNIQINPNGDDSADVQEQLLDSREIAAGTKEIPESAVPATTTAAITAASDAAATADSKAVTAQEDATQALNEASALDTRVSSTESDISTLQSDVTTVDDKADTAITSAAQALTDAAAAQSTANESKVVLGMPAAPVYPEPKPYAKNPVAVCFDATDTKIAYKTGDIGVLQSFNANDVSVADESNAGGNTIHRMVSSKVIGNAVVGIMTPRSISSSGIEYLTLTDTEFDEMIGMTSVCDSSDTYEYTALHTQSPVESTVKFSDRVIYGLPSGRSTNWFVKNRAVVTFYCPPGDTQSTSVIINYNDSTPGTEEIDLTGLEGRVDIEVAGSGGIDGFFSIRNNSPNNCYVVGVNITTVDQLDPTEFYDAFIAWGHIDYDYWLGSSNGANDFAMQCSDVGKTFGSWHGGHSNEVVTLEVGSTVMDLSTATSGEFLTGESATFTSVSDVTDGVNSASVTCQTTFANGGDRVQSEIVFDSTANLSQCYTTMTVNNSRFSQIVSPIYKDMSQSAVNDEILIGSSATCTVADPDSGHSIETRGTAFSYEYSDRATPHVKVRSGDNKFYSNPLHDADVDSDKFTAVTYRYYNE